ncbi:PREDICTED: prokineticin-2 [Thamnophis sirtalis]|uniref:Prokineticin-2 n=1 Tax=Thamnophis sirtalis TaxID=35019 RepID=A0A6I9Y7H8_9SAUR|nr:PREDICTED: prokineticin-2 [Thamnophis sirtalis]
MLIHSFNGMQACNRDLQCGGGMCCAVSLWIQSLRICTPMGIFGEDCHPLSHKIPFGGRRMHHSCPCEPNLACVRISARKYKCLPDDRMMISIFSRRMVENSV